MLPSFSMSSYSVQSQSKQHLKATFSMSLPSSIFNNILTLKVSRATEFALKWSVLNRDIPTTTKSGSNLTAFYFSLEQGWSKAFERVIWLWIPPFNGRVRSQIICSKETRRMWLTFYYPGVKGTVSLLCTIYLRYMTLYLDSSFG